MIDRLLQPLLSLHGWPAYPLVGLLVFAEAAVMLGFVFPGETAAILGGVLASKGGVDLGRHPGRRRRVRHRRRLGGLRHRRALGAPSCCSSGRCGNDRRASTPRSTSSTAAGPWRSSWPASPPSCAPWSRGWPACPPCTTGHSCAANAAGGLCWGVLYVLLGYFVGQSVEKATGIASDVLLGLILVVIVVLVVRHRRKDKEEIRGSSGRTRRRPDGDAAGLIRPVGRGPSGPRPAGPPRHGRTAPAASSPVASVSMKRTAVGSLRSTPKRP